VIEAKAGERAEPGAFSCSEDGRTWHFRGRLTFDDAARVLRSVEELPLPKGGHVDFSGLQAADSAALAVILALRRRASEAHHHRLVFEGLPPGLLALAHVYGVDELLGLSPAA
jgi:phospholipid transport system transporter-binding protein